MAGILNGSLKSLKSKEKITIVTGMSALAVLLIGVIVLLAYCTGANHTHRYDYNLVYMDGKLNLSGHCKVLACQDPSLYIEDVDAKAQVIKSATCLAEGEVEYSYVHNGNTVKCTVATAKIGHLLEGYEMNKMVYNLMDDIYANNLHLDAEMNCGDIPRENSFTCDYCQEKINILVLATHSYYYEIVKYPTAYSKGEALYKCQNEGCSFLENKALRLPLPEIQFGVNAELLPFDNSGKIYVRYCYIPKKDPDGSFAYMHGEVIIEKLEYNP